MSQFDEAQIALAGVCQAAILVKDIARGRDFPEHAFTTSIESIINTDPDSVVDVYGSLAGVKYGLTALTHQLGNDARLKDTEITRYIASLLTLERKLSRTPEKLAEIGQRIDNVKRQSQMMSLFESQMLSNLASIYKDNISPLSHKIQVAGNPSILKLQLSQDKVRALLLAGIRSAFLWRQLGGKRRNIIFQRNKILQSAQSALDRIEHTA